MKEETKKKTPIVFIVNRGFHDYSPAERFGNLVFMTEDSEGISQYNTSSMARVFQNYINESLPTDYILVSSYSVMVTVFSSMFAAKHGRINLLIFRPGEKTYVERTIMMRSEDG